MRYSRRSCGQRISRCPGPSGLSTYILGGCLTRCFRQGITKELEEKECVRLWFGFICYASGVATGISHYSCFLFPSVKIDGDLQERMERWVMVAVLCFETHILVRTCADICDTFCVVVSSMSSSIRFPFVFQLITMTVRVYYSCLCIMHTVDPILCSELSVPHGTRYTHAICSAIPPRVRCPTAHHIRCVYYGYIARYCIYRSLI